MGNDSTQNIRFKREKVSQNKMHIVLFKPNKTIECTGVVQTLET